MRTFLRRTLKTLGVLLGVLVLALGATTVWNQIATANEAKHLPEYGQFVEVDGKRMNVVVSGSGPETIVLIPGFGTAAPALDFDPLIRELSDEARVIALEPLGFGLSDPTDVPRTAEHIVTEMHEAVSQLGVEEYALMGHSIGGIYGLKWAELFGDELTAFVGIDSSVPEQANMDTQFPTGLMAAARFTGIARIAAGLGDGLDGTAYSDEIRHDMTVLANQNSLSPTYLDEMEHIAPNFRNAQGTTFPKDLPVLLFAQAGENPGQPDWITLHEEQAASVDYGKLVLLPGEHYLHHTHSPEIAEQTLAFLDGKPAR
ncbi:alpha/beta fold hydrolase [Leucobacter sp. M11]|uniref:alpha/beta fold hydrolase n=1 Tax=Leucobacter sp. M11 TaxID=2993565 RepID=UPI002D7E70E1|nr:alpha/beta hydrolase [Leucobacter sp. M11]MEB4616471.1 alpha/beta hydrolase [Leucobacter sp. M11]